MLDALIQHEANAGITLLHEALDSGTDARQFANQVVNYLRSMLLIKVGNDGDVETTPDAKQKMREQSEMISIQDLTDWIHSFNQALYNMSTRWQPSLALEMALVECVGTDVAVCTETIKSTEKRSEEPASKKNVKSQEPVVSNPPEEEPSSTAVVQPEEKVEEEQPEQESTKKEEVAQPDSSAENASGDEAAPSRDDLLSRWKEIRSLVRKQKPQTAALLNSCKSINLEGKRLKLGFESDLLRSKMDTDTNREVTRAAIQELLGIDVHIDCQVVRNGLNNHIDQATEEHGSLVKTALSLGGEIKEKE
jgi:DNA polymerase-3 subunit gamma/tau